MIGKLRKIISIANQAKDSNDIEIWTNSFKVRGTLIKSTYEAAEGVVSLMNAKIMPHFNNSDNDNFISREWLNIFEEQIIAFTVIPQSK